MTKKRICETLLCLMVLVVMAGYGLEQTMVVQTEQREVMSQEENAQKKDASDKEQAIQEENASKGNAAGKEQAIEEENTSKENTADKEQPIREKSGENIKQAENNALEEIEKASEETEELSESEVDWTNVIVYEEPIALYAQSILNVRKGPDTVYDVLGTLATNDQVEVIGEYEESKWMVITFQGEKAFVSGRYLGEEQIDLVALQAQQEAAAMAAIEADVQKMGEAEKVASEQAAIEENPAPPYIASPAGVVFVGDSRCVQMSAAVGGGGSTWICENSKRYSWFESYAVPRLDNIVGKGTKVVICMGVNDPWDYNQYAALANQRAAEWGARGAVTYFVSVNPVWENPYVTQEQVDTFNANMPGLLNGVRWIDTASIVKQGGYKLVDGLHYDTSAYINIFNLICGSL